MSYDLSRFVLAQARNYADAEREIGQGRKESHWMWYVYPQLRGLGRSGFAHLYGLDGLEEARAYLDNPVLGPRLIHMMELMLQHLDQSAEMVLGPVDAKKLRSCATLFAALPKAPPVFSKVLDMFYDGSRCELTQALLAKRQPEGADTNRET